MNYNDLHNEWIRGRNSGINLMADFAISMMEMLDKNDDTVQIIIESLKEKIRPVDDGIIENKCDADSKL